MSEEAAFLLAFGLGALLGVGVLCVLAWIAAPDETDAITPEPR